MYWTVAQMLTHHASNGCNLNPGDLLGTGTISGPEPGSYGSLMEISQNGKVPLALPNGEQRSFLEDGDEIILSAHAEAEGYVSIGFGMYRGLVEPARHGL
jgi:fumarylacetoacetase